MKLGVAIACGGHEDLLQRCVATVRRADRDCTIFVTFDGLAPASATEELLRAHGARWTAFGEQRGISAAWNSSIRGVGDVGAVCVLNDDTEVPNGFAAQWRAFFTDARHRNVRVACAFDRLTAWSIFPWVQQRFPREWGFDKLEATVDGVKAIHGGEESFEAFCREFRGNEPWFLRCRMNGACFWLTRRCLEEDRAEDGEMIWSEPEPPGLYEDLDLWMRILTRHGPDAMGSNSKSYVMHLRAVTLSQYPRSWSQAAVERNGERFRRRWPKDKWGAVEEWLSVVNALPVGGAEPPLPAALDAKR